VPAVLKYQTPKLDQDVPSFLGFSCYYRKFIKSYARKVRPPNGLLIVDTQKKTKKI
jgi:hypothetical protein